MKNICFSYVFYKHMFFICFHPRPKHMFSYVWPKHMFSYVRPKHMFSYVFILVLNILYFFYVFFLFFKCIYFFMFCICIFVWFVFNGNVFDVFLLHHLFFLSGTHFECKYFNMMILINPKYLTPQKIHGKIKSS